MREKDPLWENVENSSNNKVKCKFCGREYAAGNISRMKKHWAQQGKSGIDACRRVPDDVKEAARSALGNSCKKSRTAPYDAKGKSVSSTGILSKGLGQCSSSKIDRITVSSMDEKLAKFIITCALPPNLVELPCFIDFLRSAVEFGASFQLPSFSQLQTDTIPQLEEKVIEYIKGVEKSCMESGCTIMLEKLSDRIVLIVHARKGAVYKKSFQNSELHLNDEIISQIKQVGINNIVQLVTNDNSVFDSMSEFITNYPKIHLIPCVAHKIHGLLKAICDEVAWVNETINGAKFMYEKAAILLPMKKYTNKGLKQPCLSKFASYYQMLQSILSVKNELLQLIASAEWSLPNCDQYQKAKDIIQSSKFWGQLNDVIQVMKPLIQVLCLVEDNGSTSGYLYEAMEKASKAITGYCTNNRTKYIEILNIYEREKDKIIHPIHAAAAFLNPAYMSDRGFKIDHKMKKAMNIILSNLETNEEKEKFAQEMQLYLGKVSKVFNETATTKIKTAHPWVWWEYCGDPLPTLQKQAMRILGQPCKCSFYLQPSVCEVAQRQKMNSSIIQLWDDLVRMPVNTMFMEETRIKEEQCLKPIVIENCNKLPDYADHTQDCIDQIELSNGGSDSVTTFTADSPGFHGNNIGAQEQTPNWPFSCMDAENAFQAPMLEFLLPHHSSNQFFNLNPMEDDIYTWGISAADPSDNRN